MMAEVVDIAELERTLLAMRDMLARYGLRQPAQVMHDLMCDWQDARTREDRGRIAHKITTSYGGAGSWTDLYLGGGAPPEAEDEFRRAKEHLYRLAMGFR
jgi:hypothetical protein